MTERLKLPLRERMVGVRVHAARVAAGTPGAQGVRWLLDRRAETERREAEHQAFQAVLRAIAAAAQPLPDMVRGRLDEVAALATDLGMALAREILGAALDQGICDPTPVVAHCLRDAVRSGGRLTVRLHPADLGGVLDRLEEHPELRDHAAGVDFTGDPRLNRGAVRAETDTGRLVYDPAEVLERMCEELRREVSR